MQALSEVSASVRIGVVAPNKRRAGLESVSAWVPHDLKAALVERARIENITLSEAVELALDRWLRKPADPP